MHSVTQIWAFLCIHSKCMGLEHLPERPLLTLMQICSTPHLFDAKLNGLYGQHKSSSKDGCIPVPFAFRLQTVGDCHEIPFFQQNPLDKIINSSQFVKTLVDNINRSLYDCSKHQKAPAVSEKSTGPAVAGSESSNQPGPSTSGISLASEDSCLEEFLNRVRVCVCVHM